MPAESTPRAARAEHILDVSADLLGRLGYRRVTVDDVAEAAGVGKGTIYLHWKTREALFVAVLLRELLGSMDELVTGLHADPGAVLLHRITRAQFVQIRRRPLLCAVYTDDSEVLGKLRAGVQKALDPRHRSAFEDYLALLDEHALLREGLTIAQVSQAFHAIMQGFLLDGNADADVLGAVIARSFEPDGPVPLNDVLRPVAERAAVLFAESAAADRAVLHRAY